MVNWKEILGELIIEDRIILHLSDQLKKANDQICNENLCPSGDYIPPIIIFFNDKFKEKKQR